MYTYPQPHTLTHTHTRTRVRTRYDEPPYSVCVHPAPLLTSATHVWFTHTMRVWVHTQFHRVDDTRESLSYRRAQEHPPEHFARAPPSRNHLVHPPPRTRTLKEEDEAGEVVRSRSGRETNGPTDAGQNAWYIATLSCDTQPQVILLRPRPSVLPQPLRRAYLGRILSPTVHP